MQIKPRIVKQPADSVPYGTDIARHGPWVYVAYDENDRRIAVGATVREARELYRRAWSGSYGRPPTQLPSELEGRKDKPQKLSAKDTM